MAIDYDKQFENARSVADTIESPGWQLLKDDLEREIERIELDEQAVAVDIASQIKKGETAEQIVVKLAALQARHAGLSFIFEAVEGWKKRGRHAQDNLN